MPFPAGAGVAARGPRRPCVCGGSACAGIPPLVGCCQRRTRGSEARTPDLAPLSRPRPRTPPHDVAGLAPATGRRADPLGAKAVDGSLVAAAKSLTLGTCPALAGLFFGGMGRRGTPARVGRNRRSRMRSERVRGSSVATMPVRPRRRVPDRRARRESAATTVRACPGKATTLACGGCGLDAVGPERVLTVDAGHPGGDAGGAWRGPRGYTWWGK